MLADSSVLATTADGPLTAATLPYVLLSVPWALLLLLFWLAIAASAVYGGGGWRRGRVAPWLGRVAGQPDGLPTEHRPSYDRPAGYKVARLIADPVTGKASFLGLTLGGRYEHEDTASCEVLIGSLPPPRRWGRRRDPAPHDPPDLTCSCGFHALHDRAHTIELLATRPPVSRMFGPVLLEVDLAGTVVEFEQGYRASHQRVLGVQVPRWCVPCARLGRTRQARRIAGLAGEALARACRSDLPQHPALYRAAMAAHHIEMVRRLEGCAALRPVCDQHTPRRAADGDADGPSSIVLELADLAAGLGTEVRWLDDELFDIGRFVEAVSWPPPPRGSLAV